MIDASALRGVVWDVDDTLYLERDYVRSGFAAVGEHVGVAGFGERLWALFEEGVRGDTFNRALREFGLPEERWRELVAVYREHQPAISLLPDARAAILDAAERGWKQGVITDGPAASQHAKVSALGLAEWCSPIVVTADLGPGKGKPALDAFRIIEEAWGLSGAALIYVADNPAKDFIAPRALGWQWLRVRRDGGLHSRTDGPVGVGSILLA